MPNFYRDFLTALLKWAPVGYLKVLLRGPQFNWTHQ